MGIPEPVRLAIADSVARITLDDPANRNAVTLRSSAAFLEAARQSVTAPGIRVIVLTGTGDVFSVGGDIGEFVASEESLSQHVAILADNIHGGIRHLVEARIPVVVGLNGLAAGGGVGMALCGDVILAKRSARIASGYTRTGLTPDAGLTWNLPRLVGHARAFEIVAFNEFLSAQQALELGLVSRVVDDDDYEPGLEAVIERLKGGVGSVLGEAKHLLRQSAGQSFESHLDAEAQAIAARVGLPETLERLKAFARGQTGGERR